MQSEWYKNKKSDQIWWLANEGITVGEWIFSFDKKKQYNMFADYPEKLSPQEKAIFDKENPEWAKYFAENQDGD